jgi:hypothetical protein
VVLPKWFNPKKEENTNGFSNASFRRFSKLIYMMTTVNKFKLQENF